MRHFPILLCLAALACGCEDKTPPTWEGDGLLEATVDGTSVRLSWPEATDDALLEHRVLKDGSEVAIVGADVREHVVDGLDDATTYELTVEAIDEAGNHSEPLHATATTADETGPHWIAGAALRVEGEPPPAEAAVEPAAVEPAAVEPAAARAPAVLEWDRAEDASGVDEYKVMRGETELATVSAIRYQLGRPLEAGEREELAIVAVDAAGNESAPLRWRAEAAGAAVAAAEPTPGEEPQAGNVAPSQVAPSQVAPNQAAPPQIPPNVTLNPAQAAIVDRVRRMGLKRPLLDRGSLMIQEPQGQ